MGQKARPAPAAHEMTEGGREAIGPPEWLFMVVLSAAVFIAYGNVWHGGFIWDDSGHVTRADLRPLGGLWEIWFRPGATQQYYPVLHSLFWVEHRLWGDAATGYHFANLLLHSVVACLLYRLLRRLQVPGAHLAAAVFALHPICVESVAWVSEEKNTLSAVFCLLAALAYLRFDENRRPRSYAMATVMFILALLSKSVTATLPAALLVIFWWRRGRVSWKRDVRPLVPWFCIGAGSGAMTSWMERTFIGANGTPYALSLADRVLVAGRAVWFYAGKLIWPHNLIFNYPHWEIDSHVAWQYLYPISALLVLVTLYLFRNSTRGPLAAALLFVGTLFPALGFFNVYPFIYSYVADHFQYLAATAPISAACAGITVAVRRLSRLGRTMAGLLMALVLAALGALTWAHCASFHDNETLYLTTIERNPASWMSHNNLGLAWSKIPGRLDDAIAQYSEALRLKPDIAETHTNLGSALSSMPDRQDEAIAQFEEALRLNPKYPDAHFYLANALVATGRIADAIQHYEEALRADPGLAEASTNLGMILCRTGHPKEGMERIEAAIRMQPDYAQAHFARGAALLQSGRLDEAVAEFNRVLQLRPGDPAASRLLEMVKSRR